MTTPILFSTEMVRAILDGRKTQTRRVLKPQPEYVWGSGVRFGDKEHFSAHVRYPGGHQPDPWIHCPYGAPGDSLWVRETWFPDPPYDDSWDCYMFDDGSGAVNMDNLPVNFRKPEYVIYRASWQGVDLRWRPSIFMPRWASRITLEINSVRVERLQDITAIDCLAEGIDDDVCLVTNQPIAVELMETIAIRRFVNLWDSINDKRGFPWSSNPWVWVVNFEMVVLP